MKTRIFSVIPGTISNTVAGNSFTTIQPDSGTSPVADDPNDILTLTSSNRSISIAGNSTTDTIDLKFGSSLTVTRVPYMGASGILVDNANFTYDATNDQLAIGSTTTVNQRAGLMLNDGGLTILGRIDENPTDVRFVMGLGPSGDTARIVFGHPTLNWEVDNLSGVFRWFTPGVVQMYLYPLSGGNMLDLLTAKTVQGVGNLLYSGGIGQTGTNANLFTANTAVNRVLSVGLSGTMTAQVNMIGSTSGVISILASPIAGTYNFNLPTTSGSNGDVLTSSGGGPFPMTWSSGFVTLTNTVTLTNKRITKRVLALSAGSATPAINTNSYDVVHITAQSAAITSFTTNLTGTAVDGDSLRISITDDGTARAITWGTSFEASTVALPTTTVVSARLDVGFFWNTETSKWRCVAVA